jgi:NADPH:quinone reductase-like Zn-dependent oxidoreductase
MSPKNHRVIVSRHGGPEVLLLVVEGPPEPRAGEVRVKVHAAGVSAFDLIYRRWGRLPGSPRLPFTLGEDVVGTVDEVGEGVSSFESGQMVAGGTWSKGVGGGYSEYVCLPASDLVAVPPGVDPAEAVCLVVNYLTAHQHLHAIGGARSGERVLVHGAAGGVGTAVLELSGLAGLEVYGTASGRNHELVESLGATPIDYTTEDFVARIAALTGNGVDLVIDPVGGASHLWRSYRTLCAGGRLVWLGSAAVDRQGLRVGPLSMLTVSALRLLRDERGVPRCPVVAKYAQQNPGWYRATLSELLDLLVAGAISPVIAERVPLEHAPRAHGMLERRGHRGKVVLVTDAYGKM